MTDLLVFAHPDEAQAFQDVPHVVTGFGKVNAAFGLTQAILKKKPARVFVLGTAGSLKEGLGTDIYQVQTAFQHDAPFSSAPHQAIGEEVFGQYVTIATGDTFVADSVKKAECLALGADMVDMETAVYLQIGAALAVPVYVLKTPSDDADEGADKLWDVVVRECSDRLRRFYDSTLRKANTSC